MTTRFQYRKWTLAALIMFAAAGCLSYEIPAGHAAIAPGSTTTTVALPDFTPLVQKIGPAVVNITVTEK
jgi:S1-C subfamily serine protease